MSDRVQQVTKLEEGTVLDHLRAGTALRALRVLNLPPDKTVTLGINLPSERFGRKDIIKITAYELTEEEAAKVALISPDATLSIIRSFHVAEKHGLHLPLAFKGLIRCPNPACIVREEKVPGAFVVASHDPLVARCEYCERSIKAEAFDFV